MKTIATLGPSVRLVVIQFLMRTDLMPSIIPLKRPSAEPPLPPVSGIRVMESTPKVSLFGLASKLDYRNEYELVDVWKKAQHEGDWKMCFVRFVFCRKEHLNPLSADFVNKVSSLEDVFVDLVSKNLWATQVDLNPYFENRTVTDHQVLMVGCAGRVPNDLVFSGGHDENGRGVGPKVLLSTLSHHLTLAGNEVVYEAPTPIVPTPVIDEEKEKETDNFEDYYEGDEV